ncbi:CARDB domain-containing protein [Thermococcus sp.]|uniref:CARDB domain-containing protein n=1 Tax=Thermococcus sp. TaxID=35749 RepID=UPI00262D747B|nr:CARDB domain-containing protein [Thermococcus sp.]
MRNTISLLVLAVLLTSLVPPWAVGVGRVSAQDGEPPDLWIHGERYIVSGDEVILNATLENFGGASGPFNVTFKVFTAMDPPPAVEVPFQWINVTGYLDDSQIADDGEYIENGSAVLSEDDGYFIYKLPFTLNFFGRNITNISVSTNGYIELLGKWEEPDLGSTYGVHMDEDYSMSDIIFALDDDLETGDGYLLVVGFPDKVVVEWFGSTYEDWDSYSNPLDFQVVIFANGTIRWSYRLLEYYSYSYDLFTGYYSKVTGKTVGFEKAPGKSFEVQIPSGSPAVERVEIPGIPEGGSLNVSITLSLGEYYVKIIADDEMLLNDPYRGDNVAELGVWPGDYWVESASIGGVTPGERVEINFTVGSTSKNPSAVVELLRNGKVEGRRYLYRQDFTNGTASGSLSWLAQGGSYNLTLVVNAEGDTNETNNAYPLGEYNLPLPNFRIVNYTVRLPSCLGERALILVNVTNDGEINWSGVWIRVVLVYNGSTTGYSSSVDIDSGETVEVALSPFVIAGTLTGVRIEVDPYERVAESNESDNSLTVPLSRTYESPDFTVGSIEVPASVSTGNTYYINATIENLGGCYARSVRVNLYENGYYESYTHATINGPTRVSLRWTPSNVGEVNLTVVVDPSNYVSELNESNNRLSRTVFVSGPDIVITNVTLLSFDGIAGSEATFNVTLKNLGEAFTRSFTVKLEGALGYSSAYVSGGMGPGEAKWVTISAPLNGGNSTLRFIADYYDSVVETNESNNVFTYRVSVPLPNFIVDSIEMPDNTVGHVPVNIMIKNIGAPYNGTGYPIRGRVYVENFNSSPSYGHFVIDAFLPSNGTYTYHIDYLLIQAPGGLINVTVNYPAEVNESSLEDNSLVTNYATGYPDLKVNVSLPREIKAGQDVQINLTVLNTGNATLRVENLYWWSKELGLKVNLTDENGESIIRTYELAPITLPPGGSVTETADIPFNGGLSTLRAIADYEGDWIESNESNNVAEVTVSVEKPDPFIASYSVPEEVLNGSASLYREYPIRVNVSNAGGDLEGGFYVTLLDNGSYAYSYWIGSLASGEVREVTLYYTPKPGEHNVTIVVDYYDYWIEANESNNNATFRVSFEKPDFAVVNFSVPEEVLNESAYLYQGYPVRVNVTNLGANFGGYLYAYLYDNGSGRGSTYLDGLKTGEVKEVTLYYYPEPGRHNLTVRLDPYDSYPESNEDNNDVFLANVSFGKPELVPVGITWEPYNFTSGETVTFKVYVTNLGQAFYDSFSTRVEIWNGSTRLAYGWAYPSDWHFGSNETKELSWRWYNAKPGNLTVKVIVDPNDYIPELNESNNEYTAYLGSIGTPDFELENLSVGELAYGKSVPISVNLRNLGEAIYRPFSVLFNFSGELYYRTVYGIGSNESVKLNFRWYADKVGNITITVKADPGDRIIESDETNNEVSGSYYIEAPDLAISSYEWVRDDVARGYLTYRVNVTNLGGDTYRGFYIAMYVDGSLKAQAWVGSLMGGESVEKTISWRFNTGGTHGIRLVVDPWDHIPEANEANNEVNTSATIELPDIVVASISAPEMHANAFFPVNVTVRNAGSQDIERSFLVVIYQSDKYLGGAWVSSLPAGGEAKVTVWIRPYPGDSTIKAVADSGNYVTEVNETNNELSISVHVKAPDINVVSLSPGNITYSGEKASATVTVRNTGDYETGAFSVVIRNGGKTLGRAYAPSIAPGEEENVTMEWTTDPGSYDLTAIADPGNAIREWDEGNNNASVRISVPAPDLVVTSFSYSGRGVVGAYFNFTVTVENAGNTTLLPFHVGIYANGTLVAVRLIRGLRGGENATLRFVNAWRARYGRYTLRAVVDPFGAVGELNETNNEKNVSVVIADEKAPHPAQLYPANGSFTNETTVGVLLRDDGSGVDMLRSELRLYLNGNPVDGSSAFTGGWLVFQNSTPLQDGNYTAVVEAHDKAGNSETYTWSFVLDRNPPEIRTNVTDGALYNGSVVPGVEVIDENLKGYTVTVNGRPSAGKAIRVDGTYTLEVEAVDKAGNKAELRVTFSVNGIPHPPSGLTVNLNGSYVELSWLPSGDSDIAGYYVYRNGIRLNDEPVEATHFRDLYSGSLNYSVRAVDFEGFESDPAYLFPARLKISPERLVTGYPALINVTIENLDGAANGTLTLELVDVFGDVIRRLEREVELSSGNITESFVATVPEGLGSLRASLTVYDSSTEAVLPVEPVGAGAPGITVHRPRTGLPTLVEVQLTNHGSAPLDTSTALMKLGDAAGEPLSLPPVLMPGESATLSYRVLPPARGSYNLTFELGGIRAVEEVEVRDPVANPVMLSTKGFVRGGKAKVYVTFKNTGTAPLVVKGVSVLGMERGLSVTVPPNLSFTTSFSYTVPVDAPDEVTINATVRTDVGDFTRVTAVPTEEPPYNANVTVGSVFEVGEKVTIEGFAYNASGLLPNVTVRVAIARGDFVREYAVMTDGRGHFNLTFRPYPGESGHFVVSATHPSVLALERDGEFDIVGVSVKPDVYALRVTREFSGKIEITLVNHWEESNVSVSVSAPAWLNVGVPSSLALKPGANRLEIGLSSDSAVNGTATITFRTTQLGLAIEKNLTIKLTVLPPAPIIVPEPRSIEVGVLTNETASRSITMRNVGFETLENVTVTSSLEWVKVASNFTQLAPKEEESIALYIAPPANLTGTFEGSIRISSSNHRDVEIPIRITVTPNATGTLTVTAMDPNATRLGNASVILYNGYAHFEGRTGENGTITFTDVPIGDYTLFVSEESHYTVSKTVTVEAGVKKNVSVVLMPSILKVEWEVVPVTIEDVYVIKHEIGYSTHVPAPEIESFGGDMEVYLDYGKLAESGIAEFHGQVIVTNTHPYVSVYNITFHTGGSHYIDVEFAVSRIDELKPGESVVVPYVVRVYHHRSPPIKPCLHETKVIELKAGIICVEEAGKITLRARKVHRIVVKPTCDGCWKSLALLLGKVGFIFLGQKLGDALGNVDDSGVANALASEGLNDIEGLFDAYSAMAMNPSGENVANFVKAFNSAKTNLAGTIASSLGMTTPAGYELVYREISAFQMTVVRDSRGRVIGVGATMRGTPVYALGMGTVTISNGNVVVDTKKATSITNSLLSNLLSKSGSFGNAVAGSINYLQLIDKIVEDLTPYLAQAGLNCGLCLIHNDCTPKTDGEPKPHQLIRYGSLGGYGGEGSLGGGGGETSVERFTCEGLPTVHKKTSGSSSGSSTPGTRARAFERAGSAAGGRICKTVPLRGPGGTVKPLREGGDYPSNTLHMCIDLVISIEQRVTFERQAFRASLKFTNTNANYSLSDVNVSVLFFDGEGNPANDKFFVRLDEESGLSGDSLAPQGQARLRWLIIPKVGAAERFRTRYYVMANITAKVGNTTLVYETWPALIEVEPVPQLELDYVIPPKVYGDDPYTPEKEPPIPFVFGVRVKNVGYGIAKNLRIASAQPKIEKASYPGVYIDFRILGTLVNGRRVPNSLTIDFGDLEPGKSSTAAWLMSVEVTGDFTYYNATFRHSDELGGNETSLIRAVRTHFLFKAFNDTANDDGMLDFLVDDDRDGVPEGILDSSGRNYSVLALNFTKETGMGFVRITPLMRSPDWVYMSVPVTGYTRALRSDGKEPVAQWIENGKLHILDLGTAEFYVLKSNRKPVPVITYNEPAVVNSTVAFDASLSYDPDGRVIRYLWRIGNESFEGPKLIYTFTGPGIYNVTLTVWDDEGANASVTEAVEVFLGPRFVENLTVEPEWGVVPFNVSAYLNVTNTGDAPGTYNATVSLDGRLIAWNALTIEPGEWRVFAFTVEINETGEHTVEVNNLSAVVKAYLNVSLERNESNAFRGDFGHYGGFYWDGFRRDFENWTDEVLSSINVSTEGFDEVFNVNAGNWSLMNWNESLDYRNSTGWINATYERNATVIGIAGFNYTTLHLTQVVSLFANASKEVDVTPPVLEVSPGSGVYEEVPTFNVTACDETNVTVWGSAGNESRDFTLMWKNSTCSLWSGSLPLKAGNNTVVIHAVDDFGNLANLSLWVYINPTAPIIHIESPAEGVYNSRNVWLNYTVLDTDLAGVRAYLDGSLLSSEANHSQLITLDYGRHNLTVYAWDVSHNISKTVIFRVNEPPAVDFTWSADYLTLSFTAEANDSDGISRYLWDFGDGERSGEPNPLHTYARGGIYNVTLTVWDAYNLSASVTKSVEVMANVSMERNESYSFARDFGFYNTTSWEPFREDFENWTSEVLSSINVSTEGFDEVFNVGVGNWSLISRSENLTTGSGSGWINATYLRTAVIRGLIDHNETTLLLLQGVSLFGNASNVRDVAPPEVVVLFPENVTYDHNLSEIRASVHDESGISSVTAVLDGVEIPMVPANGTWIASVSAGDGRHELIVTASDVWGNVGRAGLNFTINTSVRVELINGTEIITIPGALESRASVSNDTIRVRIWSNKWERIFEFPKGRRLVIDERTFKDPWLLIRSSARLGDTYTVMKEFRTGMERHRRLLIRAVIEAERDGYAVLMAPLRNMEVLKVTVEKNGTVYTLSTEPLEGVGYYGTVGDYLYVVVSGDPVVELVLEEYLRRGISSGEWILLGFYWQRNYLRLAGEFEELLQNVTDQSIVDEAMELHMKARAYYTMGWEHYPNAPLWYAIYMRKAYLLEKEAVEVLRRELNPI